jgi:hypothetical protein
MAALVVCHPTAAQEAGASGADRGGFTLLLNMGVGYQSDEKLPGNETGLAGLNLGIGGWLTDELVLWFRASGTNVDIGNERQTSGVGAVALQYWVSERVNVEAGLGFGFWDIGDFDDEPETGSGIMLGVGVPFFTSGRHSLQAGLEYAAAFTDPYTVHSLGLTFGWQLL